MAGAPHALRKPRNGRAVRSDDVALALWTWMARTFWPVTSCGDPGPSAAQVTMSGMPPLNSTASKYPSVKSHAFPADPTRLGER